MYNFFNYFLAVVILFFGTMIGWVIYQCLQEKTLISKNEDD